MALSFFHGGQLVRGAQVGEQERPSVSSRNLSDEDNSNTLRLRPQAVRKLHSETALREQARIDEALLKSRPPSRPFTSSRADKAKEALRPTSGFSKISRPFTSQSYRTEVSSIAPPAETSKARPLRILGMKKPSFLSIGSPSTQKAPELPRPKSSANDRKSWKEKEALRQQQDAVREEADILQRPKTATQEQSPQRGSAFQRISNTAARRKAAADTTQTARQIPPRLFVPPKDTLDPAQFLAESLAHVIVGEWLYKDPQGPGLMPQANILQRHVGPPPRGSTGVPQRRWFRLDCFERQLSWSSKWDSTASAQHRMSRKVPIKLVFEVSNRLLLEGCIPPHAMPYDRSIVIVAPQKVLKITAPDEIRHAMWLTALQYLVDSTKKVAAHAWPDVLAARLTSLNPVLDPDDRRPVVPITLPPVHLASAVPGVSLPPVDTGPSMPFVMDKALPPTPPRLPTASTVMTPPAVPRFSHHAHKGSEGAFTTAESEGSMPGPAPSSKSAKSFKSENVEPYTSSSERQAPQSPEKSQHQRPETAERPSDELEVDQMDMLVARLGGV